MKKIFNQLKSQLAWAVLAILLFATVPMPPAMAADLSNGAKIFNANCAACHIGGNNVIISNKTLKKEALAKYAMGSFKAIQTQVTKGKNAMPAFGGRLNETQIEDVVTYVLQQSEKGW